MIFVYTNRDTKTNQSLQTEKKETSEGDAVDTSDWLRYQNKTFGYEMMYPPDWEIATLGNVPAENFSAPSFSPRVVAGQKIHPDFMVGNIAKIARNETIETDMPLGAGGDYSLIKKERITIDGHDALSVEFFQTGYGRKNGKIGMVRQQIKVINNDTSYLISLDEENEDIEVLNSTSLWENKAIFERMVASFKFLEK